MFKSYLRQVVCYRYDLDDRYVNYTEAYNSCFPDLKSIKLPERTSNSSFLVEDQHVVTLYNPAAERRETAAEKWAMLTALQRLTVARLALEQDCKLSEVLDQIHPEFWGNKYEGIFTGTFDGTYGGLCPDGRINT